MNDTKLKNLWILTEERPKPEVLKQILQKFAFDNKFSGFVDTLRILPILENKKFSFTYEVTGFRCNKIEKIYIKTISGYSSFVDFLIFYQDNEPNPATDTPDYAIEETKTDDSESRNTGVYQRCSKFVYIDNYYQGTKKLMLYNLQIAQKETPTETNIFGTRMLLTIGVEILGKQLDQKIFIPFSSVDELISFKNSMNRPPAGNVPIRIIKTDSTIFISGRLMKSGSLSHDPNIGALSIISSTLRKLGWQGKIVITQHGLSQKQLTPTNKFILIANQINISLKDLVIPKSKQHVEYWHYEKGGEKLGTIFIHIVVENFTDGYSIYENHAGSERGYFITSTGEHIAVAKYFDRAGYKKGKKEKIIAIPDLILLDFGRSEIINIEGKKYQFRRSGIKELKSFNKIENIYIKKSYPKFNIVRAVVLYGGHAKKIIEVKVGFLLNEDGDLVLGIRAPKIFTEAIARLLDFWD